MWGPRQHCPICDAPIPRHFGLLGRRCRGCGEGLRSDGFIADGRVDRPDRVVWRLQGQRFGLPASLVGMLVLNAGFLAALWGLSYGAIGASLSGPAAGGIGAVSGLFAGWVIGLAMCCGAALVAGLGGVEVMLTVDRHAVGYGSGLGRRRIPLHRIERIRLDGDRLRIAAGGQSVSFRHCGPQVFSRVVTVWEAYRAGRDQTEAGKRLRAVMAAEHPARLRA